MRLVCPNCSAKYDVPDTAIPANGRTVQCSVCMTSWHQAPAEPVDTVMPFPPQPDMEIPSAATDEDAEQIAQSAVVNPSDFDVEEDAQRETASEKHWTERFASAESALSETSETADEADPELAIDEMPKPQRTVRPTEEDAQRLKSLLRASVEDDIVQDTADFDTDAPEDTQTKLPDISADDSEISDILSKLDTDETPQAEIYSPEDGTEGDISLPPVPGLGERLAEGDLVRSEPEPISDPEINMSSNNVTSFPPASVTEPKPIDDEDTTPAEEDSEILLDELRSLLDEDGVKPTRQQEADAPEPALQPRTARPRRQRPVRPERPATGPSAEASDSISTEGPAPSETDGRQQIPRPSEDETLPSRRSRMPLGFAVTVLLFACGFALYAFAPSIGQTVPAVAPLMEIYVNAVDGIRMSIQNAAGGMMG